MKKNPLIILFLMVVICKGTDAQSSGNVSDQGKGIVRNFSVYVPAESGVLLAVDVWLPENTQMLGALPTALEFTRYWRAMEMQPSSNNMNEGIRQALDHGFAYVAVDVRGTGASFGTRGAEFSLAEVKDMPHIVDWIARQSWSDGNVVTVGTSYSGNTAELAALYSRDALVAAIPRFTDYDWYTSIVIPGGLKNAFITERWGDGTRMLDLNDASVFGAHEGEASVDNPKIIGVKPVDLDLERKELAKASAQHQANRSLADNLGELIYRDEYPSAKSLNDGVEKGLSIHNFQSEFEAAKLPMYQWGSWFDAGTAAGILARFTRSEVPHHYVIGPWSHGAGFDANPYREKSTPVEPSQSDQGDQMYTFARNVMQSKDQPLEKQLRYFTVGENVWKSTKVWPPRGHHFERMWMGAGTTLLAVHDTEAQAGSFDLYKVNFSAGTGSASRWATQLGGGDVWYGDRSDADKLLLTYTSAPLQADLELSGTAIVTLSLSANQPDAAVIVYLEDVDEQGYVRMLTEGQLRLVHRATDGSLDPVFGPQRGFEKQDRRPLPAGQIAEIKFGLLPMSALIKKGHSIRVAIAGHDKDTFVRVPATGDSELSIYRSALHASFIDLPVIQPFSEEEK